MKFNFTVPKNTRRDAPRTRKIFFLIWKQQRTHLPHPKTSQKNRKQKTVSRKSHSAENLEGILWGFSPSILLQIIKFQGDPLETSKNFRKKSHSKNGVGESRSVEKSGKGDPSALEWFLFHIRGFGCVQTDEVLSTYGKSA